MPPRELEKEMKSFRTRVNQIRPSVGGNVINIALGQDFYPIN